ncbi:sphingosine-1-phosphate phosphatase 2 [Aplysia californica]|uniref:Sphingosine-1-phosphate phosphatase 2 n=1 Tax=Aplysia californica TaxID=6500 RepID=A0ABM0JAI7_APLCA|nr:sphingosine-1-phosphate phosphatase 2 [Aplysia californica]
MTSFGQKFVSYVGHSNLTAEFQRICGIKKHKDVTVESNGVNGEFSRNTGWESTGSITKKANGSVAKLSSNGCESSATIVSNGHGKHICNGTSHFSNGVKERSHVNGKNGFKNHDQVNGLNGFTNGNGYLRHDHLNENGKDKKHSENGHGGQEQSNTGTQSSEVSNSDSSPKYTIENYLLYYIFSFGASLGNEVFYIMFFTFTIWNFDSFVVRKVCIVWCVIMYVGQAAKDVIRWPRPNSPPVVRMEERYELEYGMPSTHAMVGVAIPFGMIVFMSGRYEFNFAFGLLFAITWSVLVSFSRLYLGMHSVLDILAGICFAFFLMASTMPFVDPIDQFLISHPNAMPVLVTTCMALCLLYPSLDKWSTARGDTTLVLAVFSGIYAGLWLTGALTDFEPAKDSPPFVLGLPTPREAFLALLRQVIGVFFVVILLTAIKTAVLRSLSYVFGYDHKDPKTKQHLLIELPYRYVSYFVSSTAAVYVMPLLFLKLNIERQSYYSEVFNY